MKRILIPFLLLILTSCSIDTGNLNLMCKGTHKKVIYIHDKLQEKEDKWEQSLSFKDKRRFSIERNEFLDEPCQTWTKERVECSHEKEDKLSDKILNNFKFDYLLNRITGEVNIELTMISTLNDSSHKILYRDSDYYIGICEKVEGKKF